VGRASTPLLAFPRGLLRLRDLLREELLRLLLALAFFRDDGTCRCGCGRCGRWTLGVSVLRWLWLLFPIPLPADAGAEADA